MFVSNATIVQRSETYNIIVILLSLCFIIYLAQTVRVLQAFGKLFLSVPIASKEQRKCDNKIILRYPDGIQEDFERFSTRKCLTSHIDCFVAENAQQMIYYFITIQLNVSNNISNHTNVK